MIDTKISKGDMLRIVDSVAAEKNIDREKVFLAIEGAIQRAGRSNFGSDIDIRAHVDRKTGHISLAQYKQVVEQVSDPRFEISLEDALAIDESLTLGAEISNELPEIDFGRMAALSGKQIIFQQIREAEREQQYEYYKNKVGTIVKGIVKREEHGDTTLELDYQAEAYMKRKNRIPRENMGEGEGFEKSRRVKAYITEVVRENKKPQIFVSRTHPNFLVELFRQEVPEIYENVVEIKAVARDPGSRAKIAVLSHDSSVDPVGACVGIRGIRVRPIVEELQGEKIDIIPWDDDVANLVISALAPAEISETTINEELNKIEIVVDESQLNIAIGRRGQNVRLASQLVGWSIDIMTQEQFQIRSQNQDKELREVFTEVLNIDEVTARFLIHEGFREIEDVAYIAIDELKSIEGFEDCAEELQERAQQYLNELSMKALKELQELEITEDLIQFDPLLNTDLLIKLGNAEIKNLEDLADCASDELIGSKNSIFNEQDIDKNTVDALITKARVTLGWIPDNNLTQPELKPELKPEEETQISEA